MSCVSDAHAVVGVQAAAMLEDGAIGWSERGGDDQGTDGSGGTVVTSLPERGGLVRVASRGSSLTSKLP